MSAVLSSLCALDPTAITRAGALPRRRSSRRRVSRNAPTKFCAKPRSTPSPVRASAGSRRPAVDQHVDRPGPREHGRRQSGYLGGVAHVRAQEVRRAAGAADRLDRRRAPRLVVPDDEDLRPEPGELDGREAPHPALRPSEQHRLALHAPIRGNVLGPDASSRLVLFGSHALIPFR
jgi:hypothetical protein